SIALESYPRSSLRFPIPEQAQQLIAGGGLERLLGQSAQSTDSCTHLSEMPPTSQAPCKVGLEPHSLGRAEGVLQVLRNQFNPLLAAQVVRKRRHSLGSGSTEVLFQRSSDRGAAAV